MITSKKDNSLLQSEIRVWMSKIHIPHNVKIKIDIDAYHFH